MASDLRSSLRTLSESGLEFIVAGDIAAVLNGAPLGGFDFSVLVRQPLPSSRVGIVRLVTSVGSGRTYEDLLPRSTVVEIEPGWTLQVLELEAVIEMKEERGESLDLATMPTLRAALNKTRRLKTPPSTTSECS